MTRGELLVVETNMMFTIGIVTLRYEKYWISISFTRHQVLSPTFLMRYARAIDNGKTAIT
jgi:hypothetical protein